MDAATAFASSTPVEEPYEVNIKKWGCLTTALARWRSAGQRWLGGPARPPLIMPGGRLKEKSEI